MDVSGVVREREHSFPSLLHIPCRSDSCKLVLWVRSHTTQDNPILTLDTRPDIMATCPSGGMATQTAWEVSLSRPRAGRAEPSSGIDRYLRS